VTRLCNKIVLAGDRPDLVGMIDLLRQNGLQVQHCPDGARALEICLSLAPDLMVLDTEVALLPATRLVQILLSNPRTERMAFFYVGCEGQEVEGFRRHKDGFLPRPFNPEQLLSAILGHFNRLEKTAQVGRQEKDIRGHLDQIAVTDLVQVLGVNRKEGVLSLHSAGARGMIFLREGCVVNARLGRVDGEKAFFRLLGWKEGEFWFSPGGVDTEVRITVPVDHLIIEGLRQQDEMAAQSAVLPDPGDCLELKIPRDRLPRGLRPTTQEILVLTEYYSQVREILDHCPRPDFEVLQILKVLIDKGLLDVRRDCGLEDPGRTPLLSSEEVILIKDHLGEREVLLDEASAKLLLLAAESEDVRRFVRTLQGIGEFDPAHDFFLGDEGLGLGDIGRLLINETFALRLFVLPATREAAPLWTPFLRRLFGVLCLSEGAEMATARKFFEERAQAPVAMVSFNEPKTGAFLLKKGDRKDFHELLAFFASQFRRPLPAREES